MNYKIAIIGFGHMGKAFYEGLLFGGVKKENIFISDDSKANMNAVSGADWVLLAVKPTAISQVLTQIKNGLGEKIIISAAAGINAASIEKYAGNKKQKIIRVMPNLPVAVNAGVIGLHTNENVSLVEKKAVIEIFSTLGAVIDCQNEKDLDVITVIAGSGPAIVSSFISLLEKSGEAFGLEKNRAAKVALYTFIGTLEYLKRTKQTAQDLQNAVATKGGVTEQIINNMQEGKIAERFQKSLEAGYGRIKKIGESLDNEI